MDKTNISTTSQGYVMGLRVVGDQIHPQLIRIDQQFQKCPIAHAEGIPLYVKRLFNMAAIQHRYHRIVRFTSQPSLGVAPINWQYGGILPPAPPVLVARNDSIQFEIGDWCVLEDFGDAMLDEGPRRVSRKHFISFVEARFKKNKANVALEILYPKGSKCIVNGLVQKMKLNEKIGICNGNYKNQRISILFEDFPGNFAIRPQNLQIVDKKKPIDRMLNDNSSIILPSFFQIQIGEQKKKIRLERQFYFNYRSGIWAYDGPQCYDIVTKNLPDEDVAYNEVIVPVSAHHQWKKQLLRLTQYLQDTKKRLKSGFLD